MTKFNPASSGATRSPFAARRDPRARVRPSWAIPDSEMTPEPVWRDRRRLLAGMGLYGALAATTPLLAACDTQESNKSAAATTEGDPSAHLHPAPRNEAYTLDRELTPQIEAITYNNYYEFGSSKDIHERAQRLPLRPWEIELSGLVANPRRISIDDLFAQVQFEERLYRHRCVEAWAMAVPWTGFPMSELLRIAEPLGSARYVKMTTLNDPETMPGLKAVWYPWPYTEGLTLEEAGHELTLLGTGIYGSPMPKQNGAPLRLVVPWKYGFKSIKSIVSFEFTEERPVSFWEEIQGAEYGFWANVNPDVPHPRWSQARERMLGSNERRDTLLFNGYAEEVTPLYAGLIASEGDRLFR